VARAALASIPRKADNRAPRSRDYRDSPVDFGDGSPQPSGVSTIALPRRRQPRRSRDRGKARPLR